MTSIFYADLEQDDQSPSNVTAVIFDLLPSIEELAFVDSWELDLTPYHGDDTCTVHIYMEADEFPNNEAAHDVTLITHGDALALATEYGLQIVDSTMHNCWFEMVLKWGAQPAYFNFWHWLKSLFS